MPTSAHHGDHEHDHGHPHPSGPLARLRGLVVPHTHDSRDKVDTALEASRAGLRCLSISSVVLVTTAVLQTVVVRQTNSVALLGDTLHNYTDALTAVPIAIAFTVGRRPPTRRYTYGFGRAEDLAGVAVVLVIAASAVLVGYESLRRLFEPQEVAHLWVVAGAGLVGFAGNEVVARYRMVIGRRIGSAALVADGLHARTDGFTSLAVVLGALGVGLGVPLADPVVGLLITAAILVVLRHATREIYRRLMDAVEPGLIDDADAAIRSVSGIEDVGELRMRWIGHSLRAEVGVVMDPALALADAHALCHEVEHALVHSVGRLTAAIVHPESGRCATHSLMAHHR